MAGRLCPEAGTGLPGRVKEASKDECSEVWQFGGLRPLGERAAYHMMLPILLFIPLLYLLMIRPQQKKQKQWQQMLNSIKSGDNITTTGGIRGIIISIKDDAMVIRVAPDNLKLEMARNAIASVTPGTLPTPEAEARTFRRKFLWTREMER